ncbi:hypothetical protein [Pseudoalteromonas sp. MMG012]|nr:hypothetical protein [Pseudoalteromonas sp. MMG012]MBQ4852773.1 hypothetical protein [Pseudoalteromonas sp. MMG012]
MNTDKTPMTIESARRIQSTIAKQSDGKIVKSCFATKALSSTAKNNGIV